MRGLVWPAVRRAGALLVIVLLAAGCDAAANDPNAAGGQQGYPDVGRNLTQIPPADREAPIPEITGPDLDGTGTLSSKAYPGKVVVINVWGSWCPPCRAEAADLQAASVETAAVAQFLGVTSRDRQTATARRFVAENKIGYPSIYDPSGQVLLPFSSVLPPSAIPSTMILDREGQLAVRVLGPISKITLVQMINDTVNGK